MTAVVPVPVRFDDLDAFGHVNNAVHLIYLEEAETEVFVDVRGAGQGSVIVHQDIDYKAPVPFRTLPVEVHLRVLRVGASSYTLAYELRDGDLLYALGTTTWVAYDIDAHGKRVLTDAECAVLAEVGP